MVDWNYHLGVFFFLSPSALFSSQPVGLKTFSLFGFPRWSAESVRRRAMMPGVRQRLAASSRDFRASVCLLVSAQASALRLFAPVRIMYRWTLTAGPLVTHCRKADKSQVHCVKLGRDSGADFFPTLSLLDQGWQTPDYLLSYPVVWGVLRVNMFW